MYEQLLQQFTTPWVIYYQAAQKELIQNIFIDDQSLKDASLTHVKIRQDARVGHVTGHETHFRLQKLRAPTISAFFALYI